MRVVHERDGVVGEDEGRRRRTLASTVERPESALAHAKGLRFRRELPEDYAFVMEVAGANPLPFADGPTRNLVDMLFMRVPIDVVWLVNDEVVGVKRLEPWTGLGFRTADTIIELPAGGAEGVAVGDTVRVVEGPDEGEGEEEADTSTGPETASRGE